MPATLDRRAWPGGVIRSEGPDGRTTKERWVHSSPEGVTFTYWPGFSTLVVEASLPKVLRGENFTLLTEVEEEDGLAAVDGVVRRELAAVRLPHFGAWAPSRLDAVRQVRVGSRPALIKALRALRDVEVPRWGPPVVGQAYSCTWGRRSGQRVRAYDKWREVREQGAVEAVRRIEAGAADAPHGASPPDDLLRVEGVLRRPRLVRALMRRRSATLGDAVASGVAEKPLGRVWPRVEQVLEGVDVNEADVLRRLVKAHGWASAVRLMGYARLFDAMDFEALGEHYNRATLWRAMRDLRDAGIEPGSVEWDPMGDGATDKARGVLDWSRRTRERLEAARAKRAGRRATA